jgi:Mn-dependent DtxR family transcriptional regulator
MQMNNRARLDCSDRVVDYARSLRIRDLKNALEIPQPSINALMQYLKRKALVQKISNEQAAPYSLTEKGLDALTEMARRHAA